MCANTHNSIDTHTHIYVNSSSSTLQVQTHTTTHTDSHTLILCVHPDRFLSMNWLRAWSLGDSHFTGRTEKQGVTDTEREDDHAVGQHHCWIVVWSPEVCAIRTVPCRRFWGPLADHVQGSWPDKQLPEGFMAGSRVILQSQSSTSDCT